MSVLRRVNFLSEQRVDVPDLRSIESAVSADFDTLAQSFVTGTSQGYILRGFSIVMASAIGGAASSLQVKVDPGAIFHTTSNLSGTFYLVPSGTPVQTLNSATNTIVNGAFTPNAINYVSLEYQRQADATTDAQTYIWDPISNTQTTKITPRAVTLNYTLNISTSVPASNFLPIATVVTDASNNATEITDARWMMFRLGAGGYSPNPFYQFPWAQGRTENVVSSTSNSIDPFYGGDKAIGTLKDWMNSVMSSIQEIKGTTYWYSISSSGSTQSLREDLGNTVITGKGSIAHGVDPADGITPTAPGQVNWDEDIYIRVVGSALAYKILANPTSTDISLSDDEVAYINLVRNVAITPSLIWTNGSKIVSSVGSVSWTTPLQSGDWIKLSSDTSAGFYEIDTVDSLTQVTLVENYAGTSTGAAGLQSQYSFGSYQAVASPSTTRDIFIVNRADVPQGQDIFWFLLRSDNSGAPRVYVRFLSSELSQGESEDISGEVPKEILLYMGSPSNSAYAPQYVQAVSSGAVPEIQTITVGAASATPQSSYFYLYSSNNARQYYVWFNKDSGGTDPLVAGKNASIAVPITTGMTATQVALALQNALNGAFLKDFIAVQQNPATTTVKVTNTSAGVCFSGVDQTVGSPFAIAQNQTGTGIGNNYINDGDSLTLAIKKIDETIASIVANSNNPSYDEPMDVISGTPATSNQVQGPVTTGTTLTLPENSRNGSIQQKYTVGRGNLILFLNGQALNVNESSSIPVDILSYGPASVPTPTSVMNTSVQRIAVAFTPSANCTASQVRFSLARSGSTLGNFAVSVYQDSAGSPGLSVGGSGGIATSTFSTTASLITFNLSSSIALTGGSTYWFSIECDGTYLGGPGSVTVEAPTGGVQPYSVASYNGSAWASSGLNTPIIEVLGALAAQPGDWSEVGVLGSLQSTIIINRGLVVGDRLTYRIITGAIAPSGGSGGGGGGTGPQGPQGPAGQDAMYAMTISTKNANYNVQQSDNFLLANCVSGNLIFTIPTASSVIGRVFVFKKIDASSNILTIQTTGGQLIDGVTSQTLTVQYESLSIVTDGSTFNIF